MVAQSQYCSKVGLLDQIYLAQVVLVLGRTVTVDLSLMPMVRQKLERFSVQRVTADLKLDRKLR